MTNLVQVPFPGLRGANVHDPVINADTCGTVVRKEGPFSYRLKGTCDIMRLRCDFASV